MAGGAAAAVVCVGLAGLAGRDGNTTVLTVAAWPGVRAVAAEMPPLLSLEVSSTYTNTTYSYVCMSTVTQLTIDSTSPATRRVTYCVSE